MRNRILSFILVLCMAVSIVSTIPVMVSAEEYSGTCGENVTWVLDADTGVLTISGIGAMTSYFWDAPWSENAEVVKSIIIEDGVTSIGDTAFCGFSNLKSVDFGSTVKFIGYYAFARTGLESITVPDSVTGIGTRAFAECELLSTADVPFVGDYMFADCPNLTVVKFDGSIGECAFQNCVKIQTLRIPENATSIGKAIADGCTSLKYVVYDGTRAQWDAIADAEIGLSYYENVICTVCGDNLTSTFSDDGVLTISGSGKIYDEAFCSVPSLDDPIKKIIIGDGVTEIGEDAFRYLENLEEVVIPASVKVIGKSSFSECTKITEITLPNVLEVINAETFMGCTSLASVNIPTSVMTIGECAFASTAITEVTVPSSLTEVGYNAFVNTKLKKVNVTDLKAWCNIVYNGTAYNEFLVNGADLYINGALTADVVIPDDVTEVGMAAFDSCKSLKTIVIPDTVKVILPFAFSNCTSLKSVTMTNNVTDIYDYAFDGCDSLADVYYNGTEEEWAEITIGSENTYLTDATIHYNQDGGSDTEEKDEIVLGEDNNDGTYSLPENIVGYYIGDKFVDAGKYEVVGDEVIAPVSFNVDMVIGAQVRYGGGLDENGKITSGNGLRFLAKVDRSSFDAEGYGMKLTAEGSTAETIVDAEKWQDDTTFTVALTNMAESNYIRKFTATPFVVVKYDDGTEKTIYGTQSVTRSIYQVASGLLKEDEEIAKELCDVLNAYANQTGIRLVVKDGELKANTSYTKNGAYELLESELHFAVSDATYDSAGNAYSVILTAQGNAEIITDNDFWYEYIRINNNNSLIKDKVTVERVEGTADAVKVVFYADGLIERPADKNDNTTTDPGDDDFDSEVEWN